MLRVQNSAFTCNWQAEKIMQIDKDIMMTKLMFQ